MGVKIQLTGEFDPRAFDQAARRLDALKRQAAKNNAAIGNGFVSAGTHVQSFGNKIESAGKKVFSAGKTMFTHVGLPLMLVGAVSVHAAAQFGSSMELIRTQAGASRTEVARMSKGVLELAGSTATAPEELAKGIYHIESAGFRGAKALEALKVSAQGAKIGQADLEEVTNAMNAVLVAGVPEAKNMSQAMGMLNSVVGTGDMRMGDLAEAMGTGILASAKVFGLGLRDIGAALAVFGDNNIRGADAATKLRMAIFRMGAVTSGPAVKALASIGIKQTQLARDMRKGGLVLALQDLQKHLKKSGLTATQQSLVLAKAFGGGKTAGSVLILLQQLERLKVKEEEVGKGARGFSSAWSATQATAAYKLDQFKASMSSLAVTMGNLLLPYAIQLTGKLSELANRFQQLSPQTQNFIVKTAGIAAIGGPALMAIGGMAQGIGAIVRVAGLAVTGLGMMGPAIAGLAPVIGVGALAVAGLSLVIGYNAARSRAARDAAKGLALAYLNLPAGLSAGQIAVLNTTRIVGDLATANDQAADAILRLKAVQDMVSAAGNAVSQSRAAYNLAIRDSIEAMHREQAADLGVQRAHQTKIALLRAGKKGTLEYKEAVNQQRQAEDALKRAHSERAAKIRAVAAAEKTAEVATAQQGKVARAAAKTSQDATRKYADSLKVSTSSIADNCHRSARVFSDTSNEIRKTWSKLPASARGTGRDAGQGLADGMSGKVGVVRSEAIALAKAAHVSVRMYIQAKSPSRLWMRVGADMMSGWTLGIVNNGNAVKSAAVRTAQKVTAAWQRAMQAYRDKLSAVKQRGTEIGETWGLFGAPEVNATSGTQLLANLQAQVVTLASYRKNLGRLTAMGLSKQVIAALRAQGPSAAGEVSAILGIGKSGAAQYNKAFSQRAWLGRELALAELGRPVKPASRDVHLHLGPNAITIHAEHMSEHELEHAITKAFKRLVRELRAK